MQESIWKRGLELPNFPPLAGDEKTDVLILGGGMAGLLCAHRLRRAGVDCLVLEAGRVAGGVTGNTTAKLTSQHGLAYQKLLRRFGTDTARDYWRVHQAALEEYARLAADIPCDFVRRDNYIYTTQDEGKLEAELEACVQADIPAELVRELPLPMATAGAVCFRNQAQFHPLKFLAGLLGNLNIREGTRALALEGNRVRTDRGWVTAEKIVVATHFPIFNRRGLYFLKQYQDRSYVLALEGTEHLEGMYLEGDGSGFSFRSQGDALLLGGGSHRTGKPSEGWEPLSAFARTYYPGAREVARWAAQDCMTLDGVPYIGQYSPWTPHLFVATGFNKWGMTGSMVAAMVLEDLILERENPWTAVFDPGRWMIRPQLAANAWESAANLLMPKGPRCPHLGCTLKWNRWEHSWDCPCHGSRFDHTGKLLDAPAVRNIKRDRQ